ncbi:MAG: triose-phosphate isomerase [Hyphomicrobiaceae bacterium]
MASRTPLVAGNWKMNGLLAALAEARQVARGCGPSTAPDVLICPPATLVRPMAEALSASKVLIGGQDCHAKAAGAHTGDVSAEMLKDAGAVAVIVGHSERRADHGERDMDVRAKAEAAHRAGLIAIVCLGETLGQRQSGLANDVCGRQLRGSLPVGASAANTVIAYEPVWAIGTGLTPSTDDIAAMHKHLRAHLALSGLDEARILYGGSVKPSNAGEILSIADVDGALVGGASLKASDFLGIIQAYGG